MTASRTASTLTRWSCVLLPLSRPVSFGVVSMTAPSAPVICRCRDGLTYRQFRQIQRRLRNAGPDHRPGAAALAAGPARQNPALRYGITLNDHGYFWEAQEILEAVAAPQGGRERILLRACILIATANLRLRMQKPHVTTRLLKRRSVSWKHGRARCRRRWVCRQLSGRGTGGAHQGQTGPPVARQTDDWVAFAATERTWNEMHVPAL